MQPNVNSQQTSESAVGPVSCNAKQYEGCLYLLHTGGDITPASWMTRRLQQVQDDTIIGEQRLGVCSHGEFKVHHMNQLSGCLFPYMEKENYTTEIMTLLSVNSLWLEAWRLRDNPALYVY